MTTQYAGNAASFPATVGVPVDGAAPTAAELGIGIQALADRTANLQSGGWSVASGFVGYVLDGGEIAFQDGGAGTIEDGAQLIVESGGLIDVQSGGVVNSSGVVNVASGGLLRLLDGGELRVSSGALINVQSGGQATIAEGADLSVFGEMTISGEVTFTSGVISYRDAVIDNENGADVTVDVDADTYYLADDPDGAHTCTILNSTATAGGRTAEDGQRITIIRRRGGTANSWIVEDEDGAGTLATLALGPGWVEVERVGGTWRARQWGGDASIGAEGHP